MSYEYSYRRTARSLSPTPISYSSLVQRRNSLSDHVDNIITRSRMADQYRAKSVEPFSDFFEDYPSTRMSSSVVGPSLSPYIRTGEFYYPSYNYWIWRSYTPVSDHLSEFGSRLQSEISHNLYLDNVFHHRPGDYATSLQLDYMYPESYRGTAGTLSPLLRRDYYYWTNPARYYRYKSYYPRYYYYPSRRYYPSFYLSR